MGESRAFWVWFCVLILAACLFAFMSVTMAIQAHAEVGPLQIVRITDDPGGSVGDYYRKYKAYSDAGTEIHFHGICASACTMVLFKEFTGIKACADEGVVFAFHKPFGTSPDGSILRSKAEIKASRIIWKMWLASLPDGLHRYLQRSHVPSVYEGAEQNTLLLIPGKYLMPKCPVEVASQ